MNPPPDFTFWLRTLGVAALQITALLALVGLIATKFRSGRDQRAVWLAAFVATGLLLTGTFFGADRELAVWLKPKPAAERVIRVRTNLPVDITSGAPRPASSGGFTLGSAVSELSATEAAAGLPAVWWPAWLWLAGLGVLGGRKLIWRTVFAWWWQSRQAPAGPELGAHVAEVARRLGVNGRVRVIASPALVCPIAFGVLRPTVGLPTDFASANGTREREAMLAHELAHLSARDPLWLGLADLVAVVLWWHPLIWWARRQLRAACETAADEASVLVEDGPAVLANCLVALAAQLPRRRAFGLLGMAGFRSDLGRRVERLLELRSQGLRPTARGRLLLAAIGGTAVAVALTLASTAWALPRGAGEQPTLLALAERAIAAQTAPSSFDPAGGAAPAPVLKPAEVAPGNSAEDADQPWQASLLVQLPDTSEAGQKVPAAACMDALVRRLYATRNFSSVMCEPAGPDRIRVSLSMKDTNSLDSVKALIEQRGELEFRPVHPESDSLLARNECPDGYEALSESAPPGLSPRRLVLARVAFAGLGSSNIIEAVVKRDSSPDQPRVSITFDETGRSRFAELTRTNIDRRIALVLDGKLLMAPVVRQAITGGKCEVSGSDFGKSADLFAAALQAPLPAPLKLLGVSVTGPTAASASAGAQTSSGPAEPTNVITIQVNADGQILFAGRIVPIGTVASELEKAKAGSPELVVKLSAEFDAPMKRLVEVLDQCREAGITRIFLKTIGSPRPATNAPPASSASQPAKSAEVEQSAHVATLVQDAKLLYEMGKRDEAKAKLEEALKLAPDNQAARHYLDLVGESEAAKAKRDAAKPDTAQLLNPTNPPKPADNSANTIGFDASLEAMLRAKGKSDAEIATLRQSVQLLQASGQAEEAKRVIAVALNGESAYEGVSYGGAGGTTSRAGGSTGFGGSVFPGQTGGFAIPVENPFTSNPSGLSPRGGGTSTDQLLTRVFKVNSGTLRQSLEAVAGNVPTNHPPVQLLRSFLAAAGLDFGGTNAFVAGADANGFQSQAGKAVFYNDRNGMLLVRATARDLQTVETALQMLNTSPPQVVIEAKFVEVTMDDNKALGFDWYLGNTLMTTNASGNQPGGTASSSAGAPSVGIRTGVFPGSASTSPATTNGVGTITGIMTDPQFRSVVEALQRGGTNGVRELRGDELVWPGRPETNAHNVRVTAALGASLTGVLTDPQYRVALHALEQRSGADVLSAPRVTTLSGRQAQIQVSDLRTVVNGIDPAALVQTSAQSKTNVVPFLTSTIPIGPTLDIIPTVATDGYTIELNVVASITEFLGYDQAPADAKVTVWQAGKASEVAVPLPRFRVRQMTTKALLWDGQTLVLAGMPVEDSVTMKDKVPVLGDLPAVGNLFRSESKGTVKKNLIVFITATIIDPAGNRVHTADSQPYDPARVPPQATR